jgi:ribose-phosphate pyrophosphokinase
MSTFERIKYPDGQIGAKYIGLQPMLEISKEPRDRGPFCIAERINNYEDLFYIRSIADVINHKGGWQGYKLFIPCLFGQRSDKRFAENQSFDLKLIADIINDCKFGSIEILDPHSDVALALINKSTRISSFDYVKEAIKHYHNYNAAYHNYSVDPVLVSPDAGAFKKVFEYGEKLGLEVFGANKHRDKDGKIDLRFSNDMTDKYCFIIDDLCDGGYTFVNLATKLKEKGAKEVYLYVTHGLFFKRLQRSQEGYRSYLLYKLC